VTLSEPIKDPIMAIVSLGSPSVTTSYNFDSPFTIASQGPGYWGGTDTSLVSLPNNERLEPTPDAGAAADAASDGAGQVDTTPNADAPPAADGPGVDTATPADAAAHSDAPAAPKDECCDCSTGHAPSNALGVGTLPAFALLGLLALRLRRRR
jgi:MYXO-CTERM domain-containing protein